MAITTACYAAWTAFKSIVSPYTFTDAKQLPSDERAQLEAKVLDLSKRHGITKQIEVIESSQIPILGSRLDYIAMATGTELFPGRSVVLVTPSFKEFPGDVQEFILAHELSHIKNNHNFIVPALSSLVGVITTIASSFLFPTGITPYLIGLVCARISHAFVSRFTEYTADKEGYSICSDEGKKGSILFCRCIQEIQKQSTFLLDPIANKTYKTIMFTKEGDARFDFDHPSLSSRITAFQKLG